MEGQQLDHERAAAGRNNLFSPRQHSLNNHDFRDYSIETPGFWTFQEPFFDFPDEELPTLSVSDIDDLASAIAGDVPNNGHIGQSELQNVQALGQMDQVDVDEGYQDLARPTDNLENIVPSHYGCGFWLSICSDPGIDWIHHQVRSDEFAEIAVDIKTSWAEQSKLEHTTPTSKNAEPEEQLAWKFCNAYFERSVDNLFDAVHKPEFERLLRAHLSGKMPYHDPAWYALRNVVYATGCRIYRSQSPTANFAEVEREARTYFSNALSVHSELLLTKPSLRSVRALLAMAIFAEGFASPTLSSGLILNAALLAHSLGLHLKAADVDGHADAEALQRCWLFWAVYCCEKHIAQRCGLPSAINNDEITCEVPRAIHPGSAIELEMLTYIIQTCQLYDQISWQLLSTRALREPAEKMLSLVSQFDNKLQSWKASLPLELQPADFLKQFRMPDTMRALGLMTAHCSFYDLLIGVHSLFLYPWVIDSFSDNLDANLALMVRKQIEISSQQVANAARSLIVIARNLDMGKAGTQSFMLHFPMHAFMNLFIFVIGNPTLTSVQSDLALLDVAAGYFGQLEFVTGSKLRFSFARDIAALARTVVDNAHTASPGLSAQASRDVRMNES